MKTLPLSEAKSQLSGLVEQVRTLEEQVLITRNGRPAAVLVSAEEFERWKETIEVRGDAALMKEIRAGLRALKSRKARLYTLEELLG
ncbi:MAG: type II toxin-antitoxin system Phd/YefM family antitoxin [Betaproteobacteria bacterium]|nr:type II toxin-antitoxin system Phd/YefM family antitoxin [Betaproteobacteria bacterium]MBA3776520.1 type II toxin-antitoxin system Phd/YefM family antitoxin [Betaproteobacteria bacterium]